MFVFGRPPPPGPPRLAIPELLFEIFRDARLSRRDLARAALVCRAWHVVADVVLWEDMPGLAPLLMLMPEDAWTMTPSKRRVEKQTLAFRRALRASDWTNVLTRSCSVRRLTLFGAPPECIQRAIVACPPPANLLPKLQTLTLTQLVPRPESADPSATALTRAFLSMLFASGAPAPRHLRLRDCAPALAQHVLAHPLAARLEDATLDVRLADLARLPAPPTLRRLRVHALDGRRALPRTLLDVLPGYRALAHLAHAEITGPVQLVDADVAAVARAWPALRTLVLTPHATGASCLTLGALVPLARHCPKLEFVALPLCALDVPNEGAGGHYYLSPRSVASTVSMTSSNSLVLVLWRALGRSDRNYGAHVPNYDPILLAKFLISLFPGLKRVSNDLATERVVKGLDKEKVEDYWDTPVEPGIWDELERAMPMVRSR
ncbi:hypothetical protein EV715DRAFT_297050 [Schizophyllum commune]